LAQSKKKYNMTTANSLSNRGKNLNTSFSKISKLDQQLKAVIANQGSSSETENFFLSTSLFLKYGLEIKRLSNYYSDEEIIKQLSCLRRSIVKDNFTERLQKWPEGYAGDYKTIEMLCNNQSKAKKNTLPYIVDKWAFSLPIAQQHRNKIALQSSKIIETIEFTENPRILIVGAGSAFDVRSIQHIIGHKNFEIYFNDMDENALNYIKKKLNANVLNKSKFISKNILTYIKELYNSNNKFDLILFGGVFDYLTDKQIKFTLSKCYQNVLNKRGTIFFTNISENNDYKYIIEYFANWKLIERTKDELNNLCLASGIKKEELSIYKENTKLTYIVDIKKK